MSWFDYGLNLLQEHQVTPREVALEVASDDDDIAEHFTALRLLTEKTIKQSGYIWRFHKNDLTLGHRYCMPTNTTGTSSWMP